MRFSVARRSTRTATLLPSFSSAEALTWSASLSFLTRWMSLWTLCAIFQTLLDRRDTFSPQAGSGQLMTTLRMVRLSSRAHGFTHTIVEGIANAFNVPLELHQPTKDALYNYLAANNRGHELNEDRLRMATFPKGCDVLTTSSWVPIVKMRNVYVLPGIPRLMKQMLESNVDHFKGIPIHQAIACTKQPEGTIAAALKAVANEFPSVLIGSYVNLKEDHLPYEERSYNVQVTLYSRVESDIHAALPKAVAAIEGWVVDEVSKTE
ncbi:FAD1 flavin adenine dinucleotide synthetase [Aphanomyces cochlioides]|nr:FAD1 flavin adenine dinucleotide synthetase [Aphanomyces cochlioides]